MRISQRILSIIFIAALFFCILGLGLFYIEKRFTILTAMFTLLGCICLLSFIALLIKFTKKQLFVFRLKEYVIKFLMIFGLIIIFVEVNYLAVVYDVRWDVTRAQQHTVSETALNIIRNLNQEVQITVFYVGVPPKYLEDFLSEYKRISNGRITTEIIDPLVRIGYAAQFGQVIKGKERKAILRSGKERRDIDFTESFLTEEMLTNALVKVSRRERKVYFLTGHGEYNIADETQSGLSVFQRLLIGNNYSTKDLMLGIQKEIPTDCDVLIIAGPKNPVTNTEETLIQEYLEKGGRALFLIESTPAGTQEHPLSEKDKIRNPSLNGILNKWGIKIGDDIVVDMENYVGGDVGCPATRSYPPYKELSEGLDYTFYVRPRSISFLEDRRSSVKLAPFVLTGSRKKSWAEKNKNLYVQYNEGLDVLGPIPIAAIVWEPKNEQKISDTRIIIFTDTDFISNNFVDQYSNADIVLNSVRWLAESKDTIIKESKDILVQRLDLTSRQKRRITVILVMMPVFIAALGTLVWLKQVV